MAPQAAQLTRYVWGHAKPLGGEIYEGEEKTKLSVGGYLFSEADTLLAYGQF